MITLRSGAATDVGRVREINEDRYIVADDLFAVADGVGGHQAGEVAAQTSVEALERSFTEHTTDGLVDAIQDANQAVWQLAQGNREKRGMGTTITALAAVNDDGDNILALANVGDSRAYLLRQGELMQLTDDHSLVEELVREGQITAEEAMVHPQRSIITRALGMEPEIEVDSWQLIPYRGDRLLLCTDGLTNEVSDDRIASTLRQLADPEEAARDLVRQARANGGSDNVTVVVVDVVDDGGRSHKASAAVGDAATKRHSDTQVVPAVPAAPPSASPEETSSRWPTATAAPPAAEPAHRPTTAGEEDEDDGGRLRRLTWRVAAFACLLAAIALIVVAAIAWYARSAYFVGLDGDRVAIFRGRPGGLLWFEPTLRERKSWSDGGQTKPLTANDILPSRVRDLRAGKEEPSKADADRYVNNLIQEAQARRQPLPPAPPPPAGDGTGDGTGPTTATTAAAPASTTPGGSAPA